MILQTLLFVLLRYKMSVWELLNMKSCCANIAKGAFRALFCNYSVSIFVDGLSNE